VVAHSSKNNDFLIISVDCIHKSGSITECTDRGDIMINPLQSYKFQDQQLIPVSTFEIVDHQEENDKAIGTGRLTNLLYGLENLRKRDGDVKDED
jgi:tRNA (guanine-N(7)-)-methyltransferase subunit TRM82